MANVYEQAQAFRAELLAKDRRAATTLTRSYQTAYERINRDITRVQSRIAKAQADGIPRERWRYLLLEERRLDVLAGKTRDEIGKFGRRANIIIGGSVESAIASGREDAYRMIETVLPDGLSVSPTAPEAPPGQPRGLGPLAPETVRVQTAAIEQLTALTRPGGAIEQLIAPLGNDAAKKVGDALIRGIAVGENPRRIARGMREALGGNLTRALTISRTETLRAYREASRLQYLEASDVLDGWQWSSSLDPMRTCASCWAQHGKKFPATEVMATHPNCRCTMVPATKSWAELGFGDTPESVRLEPGADIFRRLPAEDQRRILGPGKFAAYRGKQIKLEDVVSTRQSPTWGPSTSVASVRGAEAAARSRRQRGR